MSKLEIKSPLPGTFYRRPAPDQPSFKEDGAPVAAVDVIGLVEVMKSFHEVQAGIAGKTIAFLVEDAEPVMAGQPIAEVEE
ncbi:Biotin/lipoyl attachment protein [uncultured Pleomorphomonas sp.]|uniref:Biotin carboxyl carrier protein of acetyl-CoA carboxylase n=1 Tax=uncultured Pleomorphomonas sp. TaxID=442121 RepID=A0A212LFX9_9HYPH|nr:acetyl-CoA carboxylase [uncultured Pleomorphomonas sp.]SCM76476.1 Biotin/lipoyl attachment protein [uncultured Pleomorphomonas sp.]